MSFDWTTLRSLATLTDRIGVLSLYATADPHDESPQPAWRARVRTELKRLREAARQRGPREYYAAVSSRLDALNDDLEVLLDSRTTGLGRALFAPISNGQVEWFTLQVPLTDHVALAPTAQLRPLVAAWSAAGPAGAVAVSADEAHIVDLRLGIATEVAKIPHPDDFADRRELTGRGHATMTTSYHSSASHHDLFEQREEDRLLRYLHTLGGEIADEARKHRWECIVITGEAKYVNAVTGGLPSGLATAVVTLPHTVAGHATHKLAAAVRPSVTASRAERHLRLAERACDAALSTSEAGSCGLAPTLAAVQEGRVAHLLLAADRTWTGMRAPDGTLTSETDVPPGVDPDTLVPEPRLDERMIELAIRDGAEVSILDSQAAAPLADHDGIGALLRW
ncbi:MAG TPA: VLRF1 family aeRF1-type release factor [Jiangellales bacterium]|nr:VLRF1 family aeRF1-type release factor [Jiangellales bacterium]